jgi:hypothetical protein
MAKADNEKGNAMPRSVHAPCVCVGQPQRKRRDKRVEDFSNRVCHFAYFFSEAEQEADAMSSVEAWAIAEALRLQEAPKMKVIAKAALARKAALRAPCIEAAAEGLHAILAAGEVSEQVLQAIPTEVAALCRSASPSTDTGLILRLTDWLQRAPFELKKAKCPAAAVAAASQLVVAALDAAPSAEQRTTYLEAACKAALDVKSPRTCTATVMRRPQNSSAPKRKRARA